MLLRIKLASFIVVRLAVLLSSIALVITACARKGKELSGFGAYPSEVGAGNSATSASAVELGFQSFLEELEGLQAPIGVRGDVFGSLKEELREQILERAGASRDLDNIRLTANPPTGELNRVDDLTLTDR